MESEGSNISWGVMYRVREREEKIIERERKISVYTVTGSTLFTVITYLGIISRLVYTVFVSFLARNFSSAGHVLNDDPWLSG